MTWFLGYLPYFPFNFGISKGSLVGIDDQLWPWAIKSLASLLKFGSFNEAKNGICVLPGIVKRFQTAICKGVLYGEVSGELPRWVSWDC